MTPELSLVIPTYNERENIAEILRATTVALAPRRFEIVVVDDDSPDRTWETVESIAAHSAEIRLIRRVGKSRDQAHAIMDGFGSSQAPILGKMDADGSHDPRILTQLIASIEAGHDVAVASRYIAGGSIGPWPLRRRIVSHVSTAIARSMLGLSIKDPMSGFWLIRREVYERAAKRPVSSGFKVLLQLCVKGGPCRIAEVPIHFRDRARGKTKFRARLLLQGLGAVLSLAMVKHHRASASAVDK